MSHSLFFWVSVAAVAVTLIVLLLEFFVIRRFSDSARPKLFLLAGVGIFPLLSLYLSNQTLMHQMKEEEFCGSCHVMTPFVEGLKAGESPALAALHVQHHWIREKSCYTCHTNYDILGGVDAKIRGLRHLYAYYTNPEGKKPKLYQPFSNLQCLTCHTGAKSFEESPTHMGMMEEIRGDQFSCLDCHGPAHAEYEVPE